MPKIMYVPHKFRGSQRRLVDAANAVVEDYTRQGYSLTLRQLFYRLVTQNTIANTQKEYKRLGALMSDARLAGETDWNALEDITRNVRAVRDWTGPRDAMNWLAAQYATDLWDGQEYRPEVWIEKDALAGVFGPICAELRVPFFSCRGYNSQSEAWRAAQRLHGYTVNSQIPYILHFGDHDPSGIDMTRDIQARFETFGVSVHVDRWALNMGQVKVYKLPPNPARQTDSRHQAYLKKFGPNSWELDALEPSVLVDLVRRAVGELRDDDRWAKAVKREQREIKKIKKLAMTVK